MASTVGGHPQSGGSHRVKFNLPHSVFKLLCPWNIWPGQAVVKLHVDSSRPRHWLQAGPGKASQVGQGSSLGGGNPLSRKGGTAGAPLTNVFPTLLGASRCWGSSSKISFQRSHSAK